MMETLWRDLRYGIRLLVKESGFTAIAILALALGIGANTAIFSVVHSVLLRPLPYEEPDRLVQVWEHNRPRDRVRNVISAANYLDWKEQATVFAGMAMYHDGRANLTGLQAPQEVRVHRIAVDMLSLLGIRPLLGRDFTEQDVAPDAPRTLLVAHGLWQRVFGADPKLVGQTIAVNGTPYTVIGIVGPEYQIPGLFSSEFPELLGPRRFTEEDRVRRGRYAGAIARLKPGVTPRQAQAEMDTIAARLEKEYPDFNTGWGAHVVPLQEQIVGDVQPALLVLLGAVGVVLLIACANVANLLLARGAGRRREMAIRAALGAARARLVRQMLTESLVMSLLGGALGLLAATWGVSLLVAAAPSGLPRLDAVSLNPPVLGFTLLVTLLTGVIFGLLPSMAASRDLHCFLKEGGRGSTGAEAHRMRGLLVVAEVALSLILLVGAGLLIRSFLRLQAVDPGFNANNMLTAQLVLPGSKYTEAHQRIGFFRSLLERVRALPGVQAASSIAFLPFAGPGSATSYLVVGEPAPAAGQEPVTDVRVVDTEYFRTMHIPLLRGRTFNEREAVEASHVVVINETMARTHWPDRDPLGQKVIINMSDDPVPTEIIGVVGDVKHYGLDTSVRAMAYWPHAELPFSFMTLVVRTGSDPLALVGPVRREVQALDADQPLGDVRAMEERIAASVAPRRFNMFLLGLFAALALLLASVGIYGVMSYAVTQRTQEIGIRMTLGAGVAQVVRLVMGQGIKLVLVGIGLGLVGALLLTRWLSTLLFEVSALDPLTFVVIPLLMVGISAAATWFPARRAARVDPVVALRSE